MTIIFCWTFPRTRSTALEKCMSNIVFTMHEPFSAGYYALQSNENNHCSHPINFHEVVNKIKENEKIHGKVFIKELAYCVVRQKEHFAPYLPFFLSCKHICLVRNPKETIPSLVHQMKKVYGKDVPVDRIRKAVGINDLIGLKHILEKETGEEIMVVNSKYLTTDTEETLKTLCNRVGLQYHTNMTEWNAGSLPDWKIWEQHGWHDVAKVTTAFVKKRQSYEEDSDAELLYNELDFSA